MKQDLALIPRIISFQSHKMLCNLLSVLIGVLLIGTLARISIPLPFTPVPITGQTFAVTVIALLWGRYRAFAVVGSYILVGASGWPIFANGNAGLALGPTSGYLVGMLFASLVVGTLADRGWTKSFVKAFLAAICGSAVVFAFGLLFLSLYIDKTSLLMAGLIPFLPGDFIKNILAASIASRSNAIGDGK